MPTLEELQKEYNQTIQKNSYLLNNNKETSGSIGIAYSQPVIEDVEFSSKDINQQAFEDVENRRSRNQGFFETLGIGVGRLAGKTITKTAEGAGFLAGLAGIDNHRKEYKSEDADLGEALAAWIAGAADNGLSVAALDLEKNLEDATPLYNSLADKAANKANLFHNLIDGDFWAGDAVDAGAFLLSAYLTGGAVAELQVGERAALYLAKNVLTKGLVNGNLAKIASATNLTTATALQTASEAMFEAKDVRDQLREQKAKDMYNMSFEELNENDKLAINKEAANAAAKTFALNSILLAGPNFFEMKTLMKGAGRLSSDVKGLGTRGINTIEKEADSAIKLPFGASVNTEAIPYLGKTVKGFNKFAGSKTGATILGATKGIVREGMYEENIQLAISNLLENDPTASLTSPSTYANILRNMGNNFTTEEGKKSILLGSMIGGIANTASSRIDYNKNENRKRKAMLDTNMAGVNLFQANNIFETEDYTENVDGKDVVKKRYKLDDKGNPIVDNAKVELLAKQKEHFEYLDDIATLAEENENPVLAELARNHATAAWIKAHYNTGTEDLLEAKIAHLEQLSDKEFIELGLDPSKKSQFIAELKNKVNKYTKLAQQIDSNLITLDKSKEGVSSFFARKNELYNIGTTLSDIDSEIARLQKEKLELSSTEEIAALNAKKLAYNDLKVNELEEAKTKFKEEFNKIADVSKGEKYFKNDYKKSITERVDSFNPETVDLNRFSAYEKSKMFKEKLNVKADNIENEFYEKGVEDRLKTEDAEDILNDLISNKIAVTPKTKELLLNSLTEKNKQNEDIFQTIQDLMSTGDTTASDELRRVADEILEDDDKQEAFSESAARTQNALEQLNELELKDYSKVNNKSIKEKLISTFTKFVKTTLFNFNINDSYDNLLELEKQKKGLTNMIKVLTEKNDDDYSDSISLYKNLLTEIENAIVVVKERLNDKNLQQEKIVKNEITTEVNQFGLNEDGSILNQKLYDLYKEILGDRLDKLAAEIKDLSSWAKIGYLNNLLITVKNEITPVQKEKLKTIQKELSDSLLDTLSKNLKVNLPLDFIIKYYNTNPRLLFKNIVDAIRVFSKDRSDVYNVFTKDFDFFKLKESLEKGDVKSRIDNEYLFQILNIHQQILGVTNTFSFLESDFNIVTEVVTENTLAIDDKNIIPSNQQILAIRDLIKFLFSKKDNFNFSNVAYLKGYAGTGKTNIVLKWVTKLSGLKTDDIFATGHNQHSSKAINDSIGTNKTRSIEELKEGLKNNIPLKLIVLDEINGLDVKEIKEIVDLLNEYNIRNKTEVKLIGLGDPNQVTTSQNFLFSPLDTLNNENNNMTLVTPLTIRYRSNVQAVIEAQDIFMDQPVDVVSKGIYLSVSPDKSLGAEGSLSSTGIEESLKQRDLKDGKTRVIIVHPNDVAKWEAKNLGVEVVSYIDVQGRTIDEVFIDIPQTSFSDTFMYNQAMYTAASRASNFIYFQGIKAEVTVDAEVSNNADKNTKELKEARTTFKQNRKEELEQLDKDIKLPTNPPPADPEDPKDPPVDDDDLDELDDEEDEELDEEDEEEVIDNPPPLVSNSLNFKYPNRKSLFGIINNALGINIPAVEPEEEVLYIPTINRQGFKSIGVFVNRNGQFLEMAMLSQEELDNPPADKINEYRLLKDSLTGSVTQFIENINTGYLEVSPVSKLIVLAKGKVVSTSSLKYIYGKVGKPFKFEDVINTFTKGYFNTAQGKNSKIDSSKIRIFTKSEITFLKTQGVTYNLKEGIPYLMIESPAQTTGKAAVPQFVQLERRQLNKNDHGFILNPIYEFIDKYNKLKSSLPNVSINDLALIINSSKEYLPTIIENIEKKTGEKISLSNDQIEQIRTLDTLLREPLTPEQLELKVGKKVKNVSSPFIVDGKEVKGKIKEINDDKAKVSVEGTIVEVPLSELVVSVKRTPGKAQHAFNLVARGNLKANGKTIRLVNYDKDGNKISKGLSLLPKFNSMSLKEFADEWGKFSSYKQQKLLNKFEQVYGRPFESNIEDSIKIFELATPSMTPEDLVNMFSTDGEGNVSDLRVPISRKTSFEDDIHVDYTDTYLQSDNDSLFFLNKLEEVLPTQASATLDSIAVPPTGNTSGPSTTKTRGRPGSSLKFLTKDQKSSLGEKLNTKELFKYLNKIDKTLSVDEVKFVTEAELLYLSEGVESWGLFKDGIMYLVQDNFNQAYKNVARHELFHRIFNMMLTDSQRQLVYNRAITELGLDPSIPLNDLEEAIARQYQEWREGNVITGFFKVLFNKIRQFLNLNVPLVNTLDDFFRQIDSGMFTEIVGFDDLTRNYNDIKKDFKTAVNYRTSQLYVVNELEYLQKFNRDLDNVDSETLPLTTTEMLELIYDTFLNDYNTLLRKENLTDEEKEQVKVYSILAKRTIYNNLIKDMFQGIDLAAEETTTDNFDIIGSDWTDNIRDAEETNHETKLSEKVKQFLSTIIYTDSDGKRKQVNPRYAYLLCLETLSNISGQTQAEALTQIEERFKAYTKADNLSANAVKVELKNLIAYAYANEIQGVKINSEFEFESDSVFLDKATGKRLRKQKNEDSNMFIKNISDKTGMSLVEVSALYINNEAQNTFTELTAQTSSLYRQEVYQGIYSGGKENYTQKFKKVTQDAQIIGLNNNLKNGFMLSAQTKIKGVAFDAWVLNNLAKAKNSPNKNAIIAEVFKELFKTSLIDTSDLDSVAKTIKELIESYQDNVVSDEKFEEFENNFVSNNSGRLTFLSTKLLKVSDDLRPSNYTRADGKTAYLFSLSSQAISTLQYFTNVNLFKKPAFLNNPFYSYNIFQNGISKIYGYVNYDAVKSDFTDNSVRYKAETETDWFRRNFKYFFLAHSADKSNDRYVQQFLTISNKPNIVGAEVKVLNWDKINEAIIKILTQQEQRNFANVKFNNDFNTFESLLPRNGMSKSDYANAIVKHIQEKGTSLTELLDTENYTDQKKLTSAANHHTKGDVAELCALFYANFYINSHQLNQLVAGDQAFYKDSFDVIKRMSIAFATGYKGLIAPFTAKTHYRTLVAKDIKGILGEDFVNFQKVIGKNFELTDGQGFMTPKRAAELRKSFGRAFKFGSIIKPVHFEVDEDCIPRAVKYSCVELTDELCDMFPTLKKVKKVLEDNDIDELVFESAVKVGKPKGAIEPNSDGTLGKLVNGEYVLSKKEIENSTLTLNNENYRIQSNPEHSIMDDDVAFPTQLGYFFNFSGQNTELANKLFAAQETLMNLGLKELLGKLGMSKRFDDDALQLTQELQRERLRKQSVKKDVEARVQRENEFLNDPRLGINTPFLVNKVITNLSSLFSKATVGIKIPGSGLVLQSAYGTAEFTDKNGNLVKRDLKWRNEGYAEVVLPDFWKDRFKEGDTIMFDTMLGFRIPSTELHSAVPLKVVGFYPGNKNVIIAPKEIVYFHGSDYDVDKIYVMRRETFSSKKSILDLKGKELYRAGTVVPTNKEWYENLQDEKQDVIQALIASGKKKDTKRFNALKTHLKTVLELEEIYHKNVIVESFIEVTTAKVNEQLMMNPISMERFKGAGIEEESAFDLIARLKGFKVPKPLFKNFKTLELFDEATAKWIKQRNSIIYKERNLYDLQDQMLMHQDNFSGTKLTGSFANMAKVIAYFFQSTTDGKYPQLSENNHINLNGKDYTGFNYYENVEETIVNYDSEGNPVKGKPTITETIDSLINAAIDNVKEQILPVIGFTNNTGGAAVSMIAMGIPVNDVIRIMKQPIVEAINNYNSYSVAYIDIRKDVTKLVLGENPTETAVEEMFKEVEGIKITSKDLESTFGKQVKDMTKEELKMQLAVLTQMVNKADTISESISKGSKAYSVLKSFPIDFAGVQSTLDAFDALWNPEKNEKGSSLVFTNVNPIQLPHINKAFKVLQTLKSKIENLFFVHSKSLQAFSEEFYNREVDVMVDKGGVMVEGQTTVQDFKTKKDNNSLTSSIRSHVMHYLMTGLSYTTPEGYTIENSTINEPPYTSSSGKIKTGADAFNSRFRSQVLKLQKEFPLNKFLNSFYINQKGKLIFNGAKNLDQADVLMYQMDFEALKENNQFTKFQYEFVKYAVINQGLSFGSSNYSLILPSDIYVPMMEQFNNYFGELTADPDKFKSLLDNIKLNFKLQYAINTGKTTVPFISKEKTEQGTDFHGIIMKEKTEGAMPKLFITQSNNLYLLVDPENLKYVYVSPLNEEGTTYQFDNKVLGGNYSLTKAFDIHYPVVKVNDNTNTEFKSKYKYEIGKKIRMVNYSDVSRLSMVEAEIESAEYENGFYNYKVKNPIFVSTVLSDTELTNSNMFRELIKKGYSEAAALHSLKNNC